MAKIEKWPTPMRGRDIGDKTHNASELALAAFYFPRTNGFTAHFRRELHTVNDLDANALIGVDVLHPEG